MILSCEGFTVEFRADTRKEWDQTFMCAANLIWNALHPEEIADRAAALAAAPEFQSRVLALLDKIPASPVKWTVSLFG